MPTSCVHAYLAMQKAEFEHGRCKCRGVMSMRHDGV